MQNLKDQFKSLDGSCCGSIQSCVRTNDLQFIGDGTHLTYFEMIGNFSFGGIPYEYSVHLWTTIIKDLGLDVKIHVHPDREDHAKLWKGFETIEDQECVWSDGEIGGYCCEIYCGDLEIGNLVNTLGHSTDVGFGLERLLQVCENKSRVDETSLFDTSLSPIVRDHIRALKSMKENGVFPGNKGRNSVCRRLLRRIIQEVNCEELDTWILEEKLLLEKKLPLARKLWKKHKNKSSEWWYETCGVYPEEIDVRAK